MGGKKCGNSFQDFSKGGVVGTLTILIRFAQGNAVFNFIKTKKKLSHVPLIPRICWCSFNLELIEITHDIPRGSKADGETVKGQ